MVKNGFTAREDRFIMRNCKKMTYAEIALHLSRPSEDSIGQRVKILERQGKLKRSGVVRDGVFHPFYSEKEDEIIRKFYPFLGKKFLARKLKRRLENSIRYRVGKLHIKREPPTHLNPPRIAQILGVCPRIVLGWIYQGFLKADNQHGRRVGRYQEWVIKPPDFHEFLRDYYYLYDPTRVKDESLKKIVDSTPAAKTIIVSQAAKVLGVSDTTIIKRANRGEFPVAYKGFGPKGHRRWYVELDIQRFLDLPDDRAAEWLVETARLREPDSIKSLDVLLKCKPERVKEIRRRIKGGGLVADRIIREFEATPEGRKLRSLIE